MSPASGDWTNPSADTLVNISQVSIQLMSPASGDLRHARPGRGAALEVSIQLMSPASGDTLRGFDCYWQEKRTKQVSIQLMSPASGDIMIKSPNRLQTDKFPFN